MLSFSLFPSRVLSEGVVHVAYPRLITSSSMNYLGCLNCIGCSCFGWRSLGCYEGVRSTSICPFFTFRTVLDIGRRLLGTCPRVGYMSGIV